ncbi:aldehyde dehydrogenase, dimeric NADP-preferring-like [Petaurus breviceps papuanus]|uniref:aldehyde dehydrogenase, dimeric NADP-preferring-like n=1 Tax=Petaurus breviceps papuanus TaxID=3040969 RepID=UPI0036DD51CB
MSKISETVKRARAAFNSGKTRPLKFRMQQLENLQRMMMEKEEEIAAALYGDLHKSKWSALYEECIYSLEEVKQVLANLPQWIPDEPVEKNDNTKDEQPYIHSEPLGVVLIIGAWNYPFNLSIQPLVGAIAAGNAVVLKPSEVSEQTAILLAKLFPQYLDKVSVSPKPSL